jgi:hypothetical protein
MDVKADTHSRPLVVKARNPVRRTLRLDFPSAGC